MAKKGGDTVVYGVRLKGPSMMMAEMSVCMRNQRSPTAWPRGAVIARGVGRRFQVQSDHTFPPRGEQTSESQKSPSGRVKKSIQGGQTATA